MYNNSKHNIKKNDAQKLYKYYKTTLTNVELLDYLNKLNIHNPKFDNIRKFYNDIICELYPNEAVIKSSFINNVIFRSNTHTTIFELSVGNSRVDLCKINSYSTAFEIKTQFDNFNRLQKQILDYLSVFEKVYAICPVKSIASIKSQLPEQCGIYSYHINKHGKYIFKKVRNALKSNNLNPNIQLALLTKVELRKHFNVKNTLNKSDIILEILNLYSAKQINCVFKNTLKEKYDKNWLFLKENASIIYDIDYQWFFKHNIDPHIIYLESLDS